MIDLGVYAGLFAISFFAATILPAQSEIGLAGLIIPADYSMTWLIIVARIGKTLGAVVKWVIGLYVNQLKDKKWFPVKPAQLDKATGWYHKYGRWSLLLSWAPFIGDPLTLAAGVLREPFWSFFILVAVAKTGRYIAVAALTLHWV